MDINQIIEQIARENGISADEVRREMQEAINAAYENPTQVAMQIPKAGMIPTVDEILKFSANQLQSPMHNIKRWRGAK